MPIPDDYARHFENGGQTEGSLSVDPGWFVLWPPADVAAMNEAYDVAGYAPGFIGFGSNGGGEMLAFDGQNRVVMLPFIGMAPSEVQQVAACWADFVSKMER
jgi:hypothetical protein